MNRLGDYHALKRSGMTSLLMMLVLGSWVTVFLVVVLAGMGGVISVWHIAQIGTATVIGMIVVPVIGIGGGAIGASGAKRHVIRDMTARPIDPGHPLSTFTAQMAGRLGMEAPTLYVYPDVDINAWATGSDPSDAAIGLSEGALQKLDGYSVAAVIGHELGHIASGDLWRMQFAVGFQNALYRFALWRGFSWTLRQSMGVFAELGVMGLSRKREYWADAIGAALTSPEQMKQALVAVHQDRETPPRNRRYYSHLLLNWSAGSLFGTHPTLEQRLAALDEGAYYRNVLTRLGARVPNAGYHGRSSSRRPRASGWLESPAVGLVSFVFLPLALLSAMGAFLTKPMVPSPVPAIRPIAQPGLQAWTPRVAAWSRVEGPVVALTPVDDLANEPPGYRCFKQINRQLPAGLALEFDERNEWQVYAATTLSGEAPLRQLPHTLRACIKQNGGRLSAESSVEKRRIEVWALADEINCWFTPTPARRGSGPLTILGTCHSPTD